MAARPCRAASRFRLVATQHHHLQFASRVESVSAHSSTSLCANAWEVHCQCFASVILCAGAQRWYRLACASCWVSRSLRLGLAARMFVAVVAHARYGTHFVALRVYIGCYFVKWPPVSRRLLLWQPPLRALAGLQNPPYAKCLRWVRSHSRRRSTVAFAPYAPPVGSLLVVVAPWHWLGASRCILVSGLRPVMVCVPARPRGLAAARHWPCAGLPVRPEGSLSPALRFFGCRDLYCVRMHGQSKDMWPLRGHKSKSPEHVRALPKLTQHSCFISTMGRNMGKFWKTS